MSAKSMPEKVEKFAENALKTTENRIEQLCDTVRVKAHLGTMDATDAAQEIGAQVSRLNAKIGRLEEKATAEIVDGLKKLSDACLHLHSKLVD
jgi:hypothetical protein